MGSISGVQGLIGIAFLLFYAPVIIIGIIALLIYTLKNGIGVNRSYPEYKKGIVSYSILHSILFSVLSMCAGVLLSLLLEDQRGVIIFTPYFADGVLFCAYIILLIVSPIYRNRPIKHIKLKQSVMLAFFSNIFSYYLFLRFAAMAVSG